MRVLRKDQLICSLLEEVAGGSHPEGERFIPRRRIEAIWGVSNNTAVAALSYMVAEKILVRVNRKLTVLAPGGLARARVALSKQSSLATSLARSGRATDPLADGATASGPDHPNFKPLRSEHLAKSLLVELASCAYVEGGKFLSVREIQRLWGISRPTVERARHWLSSRGLLCFKNPRVVIIQPGAANRACLLLEQMTFASLPPPDNWNLHRNRILHGKEIAGGYRLALIHDRSRVDPMRLHQLAGSVGNRELSDQLFGQRDLVAFLCEAKRHSCTTRLLYDDGSTDGAEALVETMVETGVQGVAIMELRRSRAVEPLLAALKRRGISVVSSMNSFGGLSDASIECNETAAGYAAMKVLLDHGHRDILVVDKDQTDSFFLDRRREGAAACIADNGLAVETRMRYCKIGSDGSRARVIRALFNDRDDWPTAILMLDTVPLRKIDDILHRLGVRIPQDVSVIACGPRGFKSKIYGYPDVMDHDRAEMGTAVASALIAMIHGDPVQKTLQMPLPYIKRGTVQRVKEKSELFRSYSFPRQFNQ